MSSLQAFYDGLGHQHTKGANGSRYQSIYEEKCKSKKIFPTKNVLIRSLKKGLSGDG